MSDEYYDEDGFRLEFEDDTSDQEKQFFMRAFPNVNKIAERKVHCTSCYMHIGTAPITEAIIRMHPVLRVSHCRNCHTFYNSGEFDKGEDGSELYCRWCGQGGEVYCCSKCPYVFCKKCIVQNLSRACVQDISRNDNWQCFSCAPKIMWHLRAQHWALVNYIEKQKKDMKDKNLSVQTINNLMKQDNTACCSGKGQNKKNVTPVSTKKAAKRPSDANDFSPGAAKIPEKRIAPRPILPVQQQSAATPPSAKKAKTDNNEVVCTPDIMSMFMSPEEPPPLVATRTLPPQVVKPSPPKPTPPPTTMPTSVPGRQVVVRPAIPANQAPVTMRMPAMTNSTNSAPPPVYHTINGYRIDLHTAAQQGTYRLPNGKLIQVRKQAPTAPPGPTAVPPTRGMAPKPPNAYFNPVSVAQNVPARMTNGGSNMHINMALQQQQQLQEQRLQQQRQQAQQQQQQQQLLQQQRQQQLLIQQAQSGQPQPTIVAGQINPALQLPTLALLQNMVNGPHEDSPLGKSRKNFEGKLLSGVEICQHIVNKINTLTNSNSFKNIRNVRDLKELYIHVSYLLTYAIGRFKTLQEKCVDDVKKMGFTKESDFVMMGEQISNRNPDEDKSDDEDDCEIIEQSTTLIELDSEDEDDGSKKKNKEDEASKRAQCPKETEAAVAAILQEKNDANTSVEAIAVDSEEQVVPVDKESPSKDAETATAQTEPANSSSEETTDKEVVTVDSSETIAEKNDLETSKSDDDLVEIVDENVAPQAEASDKADDTEVASKDAEKTDAEEIVEANEGEAIPEQVDGTEETSEAEDKIEAMATEDKTEAVATEDKTEAVAVTEEDNEESAKVQAQVEEKSNEAEETPMESAEVEKTDEETQSIKKSGEGENEDKENKSPEDVTAALECEKDVAEKEADNTDEGEQAGQSEKMEVDAHNEDKADEGTSIEEEESKPSEPEDVAASSNDVAQDPMVESVDEHSNIQESADEQSPAVEEPAVAEPAVEEPAVAEFAVDAEESAASESEEPQAVETHDETSTEEPEADQQNTATETPATGDSEIESSDNCESVELAAETAAVEDTPAEETTVDEMLCSSETPFLDAPVETNVEAEASVAETPVEEVLDVPTGNELLAQIEDSFLKLQEMIDSTEEATGESSTADEPAGVDQEMADETPVAASAESPAEAEQMEVDEEENTVAVSPPVSDVVDESQEAASPDEAGSPVEHLTAEEQTLPECNGELEENGTSDSNGTSDELEQMPAFGDEMLEMGKMITPGDLENIDSPEMISGDY